TVAEPPGAKVPPGAVHALQRQAGNHATAQLLQRAPVAAMGPGMSGGGPVAEEQAAARPPMVYPVSYGGMVFQVPEQEMPRLLEHIGPALWRGVIPGLDSAYAGVRAE